MVWGMIWKGGRKLIIFPEGQTMTSEVYIREVLRSCKVILKSVTFMQDGAKAHTAHDSMAWLGSNSVKLLTWQGPSPDANPIENVWAIVAKEVSQRGPYSYAELCQFVQEEFNKIPQSTLDSLVDSFEGRLQYIARHKGGKYH